MHQEPGVSRGREWNRPETEINSSFLWKTAWKEKNACLSPLDTMVLMDAIGFCVLKDTPGLALYFADFAKRDTRQLPEFQSSVSRIFLIIYFVTILSSDYAFLLLITKDANSFITQLNSLHVQMWPAPFHALLWELRQGASVHMHYMQLTTTWFMKPLDSDPGVLVF